MENPFIASVADCLNIALETIEYKDMPILIVFDREKEIVIAEPVARFYAKKAVGPCDNYQILCVVDHHFFTAALHAARLKQVSPPAGIINI